MTEQESYWKKHKFLPKSELKDGVYYRGSCRNASVAQWDAKHSFFWYMRDKFGAVFEESICHPEDDNGFDLFLPEAEEPNPEEYQTIKHI